MDIHKSLLPRDWHVTIVTRVSRQAAGTRDRVSACGELSCQPREEFHSKSHNASRALLLASLADGSFVRGKAQADVTSGTGALCGWQARGEDRKRKIEQRADRTEKQQQRNGRISKGAGLSSGGNGDSNDNFVFHHYEDYHLHMQHYRYYHTVSHAGRACADLLHLDAIPQSTSGSDAAQEQSRKPAHTPAMPAATTTLPEITTSNTTTTITTTTVSTTVTTPFVLARAPSCLMDARLRSSADVSLCKTPTPRAVTSPSILSSVLHRRGVSRSWGQSWGQYKQFCRLREALTDQQKRREAVRCQDVADFPRAGDDKGDNVTRGQNSDITKIAKVMGANGALLSIKRDFQKVTEGPVFGIANDLTQNWELCFLSGTDGRGEADSSQREVLRYIVSQAKRQTVGVESRPASPPVDDARAFHPVKRLYQDCVSHQHQNSPENSRSIGFPEDLNAPETGSTNVSLEFARLPGGDGKSASDPVCSHSGSVRTRENDLWTASHGTYANRFSQIDWFTKKKKGLRQKLLPDGTHDEDENSDKKLELDSETSVNNSRNLKSNIRKICQGDGSATEDKQAALRKRASKPKNKVGAVRERWKHDGPIRRSPVKSAVSSSSPNTSDSPVAAFTSGHAHPTLSNGTLVRRSMEHIPSLPPRLRATKTPEADTCPNVPLLFSPFKARFILSNKHLDDASGKIRSSTMTSKSPSTKPFGASPAVSKSFVHKALLHSPVKNGSSPSTGESTLPKPEFASYIASATTTSKPAPLLSSSLYLHISKAPMRSRSSLNFHLNSESRTLLSCADEAPAVCSPSL